MQLLAGGEWNAACKDGGEATSQRQRVGVKGIEGKILHRRAQHSHVTDSHRFRRVMLRKTLRKRGLTHVDSRPRGRNLNDDKAKNL